MINNNNNKIDNNTSITITTTEITTPSNQSPQKRFKIGYNTQDSLTQFLPNLSHSLSITGETPSMARDLVKHLDNNLSTPQIEKLLESFADSNGYSNLHKTPGSALVLLTPISSSFYQSDQTSSTTTSNPTTINTTSIQHQQQDNNNDQTYINLQDALLNHPQLSNQLYRTISEVASSALTPTSSNISSLLMNPNNIFANQQQNTKYTTLTDITTSDQINDNKISITGVNNNNANNNFYVQQQDIISSTTTKYKVKDELQTVPIHPHKHNNTKLPNKKRNNIKISSMTKIEDPNVDKATTTTIGQTTQLTLVDLKTESIPDLNSLHRMTNKRRDTDNSMSSQSSSNLDTSSYSPINMDGQETLKLEKKRERNREAARKCRTRKLEKIAKLELEVKILIDTNNQERAKTNSLNDEIAGLRKKMEAHQKLHNCNLSVNS